MTHNDQRLAEEGDNFLHAAEAADAVQDRHQLFVWLRLHFYRFVPHDIALFLMAESEPRNWSLVSTDNAARRTLMMASVPLPARLADCLSENDSSLWSMVGSDWIFNGRKLLLSPLGALEPQRTEVVRLLADAGYSAVVVQGLDTGTGAQPDALFAFVQTPAQAAQVQKRVAALLLPHLYLMATRAFRSDGAGRLPSGEAPARRRPILTQREVQVISAVREAHHNAEIGEMLGITAATVKNHLRKIMRKLGASNRAQAVAEAMQRRLIQ